MFNAHDIATNIYNLSGEIIERDTLHNGIEKLTAVNGNTLIFEVDNNNDCTYSLYFGDENNGDLITIDGFPVCSEDMAVAELMAVIVS